MRSIVTIKVLVEHGEDLDPIMDIAVGKYVEDRVCDAEMLLLSDDDFKVIEYLEQDAIEAEGDE